MENKPKKILFVCTHNRCRSILCEAITNQVSNGMVIARSAGSQPQHQVHPLTLKYLAERGFSTQGLSSQSWDEHRHFNPDLVVMVCDSAAREACPTWLGSAKKMIWSLPDPSKQAEDLSAITGAEIKIAFDDLIDKIMQKAQHGFSDWFSTTETELPA